MPREITIQGKTFPSITAAARHFKIGYHKFYWHLVHKKDRERKPRARCIETTIRGVTYPSQKAAAKALGVSTTAIHTASKIGTLDNVGLRKAGGKA